MAKMNAQTKHWVNSKFYRDFTRQIHLDIYVGLKNGIPASNIKAALHEMCQEIENSVNLEVLIVAEK